MGWAAFPVREVFGNGEANTVNCRRRPENRAAAGRCRSDSRAGIGGRATVLRPPSEAELADTHLPDDVDVCLAMARSTSALLAGGDRLAAARAAVELVRAYDRVLENIRLIPLSLLEQQRVRDQLAPVAELLRKYRLR